MQRCFYFLKNLVVLYLSIVPLFKLFCLFLFGILVCCGFSHRLVVVERFGEFIVARWCWCVLLSFVIYRKFVGGVGLFVIFSLAGACCFVMYSMLLEKFCLCICRFRSWFVFLTLIFWEGLLVGLLFLRFSLMDWFFSFVILVSSLEYFGLFLGESCSYVSKGFFWTLLLRDVQENLGILKVMHKLPKCILTSTSTLYCRKSILTK